MASRQIIKMKRVPQVFTMAPETLFTEVFSGRSLSQRTKEVYMREMLDFVTFVQMRGTRDCYAKYRGSLAGADVSSSWKNRRLVVAKHLIHYCVRNGLIKKDITVGVRGFSVDVVNREHYGRKDMKKLFDIVDLEEDDITRGAVGSMLALMAYNGLRASEVCALQRLDVDLGAGVLRIRGKGGRVAEQPILPETAGYLADYLNRDTVREAVEGKSYGPGFVFLFPRVRVTDTKGVPMPYNSLRSVLRPWLMRAGLGTRLHRLRAYAITRMYREGGWRVAKEFARHADLKTTEVYLPSPTQLEIARVGKRLAAVDASNDRRRKKRGKKVVKRKAGKKRGVKKRGQGRGG